MLDLILGLLGGLVIGFAVAVQIFATKRDDARLEAKRAREAAAIAQVEAAEERARAIAREEIGMQYLSDCDRLTKELADAQAQLEMSRSLYFETTKRAETAETIARGQAKHIESLQQSNDRMLTAITDMRRVGFALPLDIADPDGDTVSSIEQDDAAALELDPRLVARD